MIEFIIPYKNDIKTRYNNLLLTKSNIINNLKYNIIIGEYSNKKTLEENDNNIFLYDEKNIFNKSKIMNYCVDKVKSPYVCICDCDTIFEITAFKKALELLISKKYDFIFPFDKPVYDISPNEYIKYNRKPISIPNKRIYSDESVGGIIMFNKEAFYNTGRYNENIIGWGGEDFEFYIRICKLGFRVNKIKSPVYHLRHFRVNPLKNKDTVQNNYSEVNKIKNMSKDDIKKHYNLK